jgi:FMN phosphatase YigB (HAD superfamily)
MLKTIIFRCEEVILNDEYLQFKIYQKLWYYLRQDPAWVNFETVLKLREYYVSEQRSIPVYPAIASSHLSERNRIRFEQDVQLFLRKQSSFYLRTLPAMLAIIRNLKYYYKIALIARKGTLYQKADQKYRFDRLFHFVFLQEKTSDIHSFRQYLQEIMQHLRSSEKETLLVSSYMYPDLAAAGQLGILNLHTSFDPKTRGFQPQNYLEWQYYHSLKRIHQKIPSKVKVFAVANHPSEVSNIINDLERKGAHSPATDHPAPPEKLAFWDLVEDIFNIPIPPEEK